MKPTTLAKFYSHLALGPGGCRLWTSKLDRNNYGHFTYRSEGRNVTALVHRLIWQIERGPIPRGLVIHHTCGAHNCVNLDHLELLTGRAATLRGNALPAQNARKTHCKRGHPFTRENLSGSNPSIRSCLTCKRERHRLWCKANPEKVRQYAHHQYWKDPEKRREQTRKSSRRRYDRDPEYYRAKGRERYRKNPGRWISEAMQRRYGITLETFRELAEKQNGRCAICGNPPRGKRLCIDHDHDSGRVRGLLCHRCNRAIGFFGDSPELLAKALAYLGTAGIPILEAVS